MKQHSGTIRQKVKGGSYYYRVTVASGLRKEFSLKTKDLAEAKIKATELAKVLEAETKEVAFAQINAIKGFSKLTVNYPLREAWDKYAMHPERAMPHTVSEQQSYQATFNEFVKFTTNTWILQKNHSPINYISDVNNKVCEAFSMHLKTTAIAVDTHNRKIKRLRKIFSCLNEYYDGDNPFQAKALLRQEREEQGTIVRRQAFTREQEEQLKEALVNPKFKVPYKEELRVIYYIGMFTGQRLKDCVLLQWQNIDLNKKRIWVKQFKTGKEVTIPIANDLLTLLHEALAWRTNQYVCPKTAERYNGVDANNKNIGNNLVNKDALRFIRWIGLEPSVTVPGRNKKMTVYGFHSLRHSFASHCAEAGVPKAVLLSILGTDSEIADKYYTHIGDDSQRKAIDAISNYTQKDTAQDKIDKVLTLLELTSEPTLALIEEIKNILKS